MSRKCGDCQLCCKLLPVDEGIRVDFSSGRPHAVGAGWHKPANTKCQHQGRAGCRVYGRGAMPECCKLWNCRWLVDDPERLLPRPDRAGYVIDVMPDIISMTDNDSGATSVMEVVQVWVDPARRESYRDERLLAYLEKVGKPVVVRFSSTEGITMFPPALTGGRGWVEHESANNPELVEERRRHFGF